MTTPAPGNEPQPTTGLDELGRPTYHTNPVSDPYDQEFFRVWDTERVSPRAGFRFTSERPLIGGRPGRPTVTPVTPAELSNLYDQGDNGR